MTARAKKEKSCPKMAASTKNEKNSCPAFKGQTTGGISTKHYWSDKYYP
jgi:hypothetical protein